MALSIQELRPYSSLLLARATSRRPSHHLLNAILDDIADLLALGNAPASLRRLIQRGAPADVQGLAVAFLHYVETVQATWTTNPTVTDTINHLVLACIHGQHGALLLSDSTRRAPVSREFGSSARQGLGELREIEPALLNAAFVRGEARTLWLSGTHRSTSVKADAKILSGRDLRDALDPLGDQTYVFTAARIAGAVGGLRLPVGCSPRQSRIWVGANRSFDEFCATARSVLQRLEATATPIEAPLPIVAVPCMTATGVARAFDVVLEPAELLADDGSLDPETRQTMELWANRSSVEVTRTAGADFEAKVVLDGGVIGTLEFRVDLTNPRRVGLAVTGTPRPGHEHQHREACTVYGRRAWVKIRYESGHTLSDGSLTEVRHRDIPFEAFDGVDFAGFDVSCEKPEPLSAIGSQTSLFCWVRKTMRAGWLACDDGAMEIGDFVRLEQAGGGPALSLIHVKGAKSSAANRQISVSAYEVVTAQAIKNLRHLDRLNLEEGLADGLKRKIGTLVWRGGRAANRQAMIRAIRRIGIDYGRRVLIVQPHLTKARVSHARSHPKSVDAARLRQLDTLLIGAQADCRALGAELRVIIAK